MAAKSEPMKASSTRTPVALNAGVKTAAASEQTLQRLVCMPCNGKRPTRPKTRAASMMKSLLTRVSFALAARGVNRRAN